MGNIIREPVDLQYVIKEIINSYLSILCDDAHRMQIISKSITDTLQAQGLSVDDAKKIEKAADQLLKEEERCENSLREIIERQEKQFEEEIEELRRWREQVQLEEKGKQNLQSYRA